MASGTYFDIDYLFSLDETVEQINKIIASGKDMLIVFNMLDGS